MILLRMGIAAAYPVFRTTDPAMAFAQAERLAALLAVCDEEVDLFAEFRTVPDLRRVAAVLPEADFDHRGHRTGPAGEKLRFDLDIAASDDAALEPHLPMSVMTEVPRGSVERDFVAALGSGQAAVNWSGQWPEDPETDCCGSWGYDGVQVVFHGEEAQWGEWTGHHTVFVSVYKSGDLPRAEKLAAHIGSEVLGARQQGW